KSSHGDSNGPGTGCCGVSSQHWSWIARVLQQIEQDNLSRQGNIPGNAMNANKDTLTALTADPKVLNCPSDVTSPRLTTNAADLSGTLVGVTNYKGVSGANWGTDFFPTETNFSTPYRNPGANPSTKPYAYNGLEAGDGIFWRADIRKGSLKITDIADGTSNTLMIGEDIPEMIIWNAWSYANGANGTCAIPPNTGVTIPTGSPPTLGNKDNGNW